MVYKRFRKKNKKKNEQDPDELPAKYENIDESKLQKFKDLPLSTPTQGGLKDSNYFLLTDIQKHSIHLALKGNDILGAAKTGSGKTLAFLVPILEILYCNKWSRLDGLGALIITPTRELAYQIFETIRKIGRYHEFSVGLIIGGKDLHFEKKRLDQVNIMICTPGRLLHHMDTNANFNCTAMKILVLDEADRCLDMGFEKQMNAIIENLPPERQTLLFSATQTKSVKDLARLSLKDPLYISVHEHATHTTPEGLQQSYVICELEDKIAMLWSFIRNHLKQKVIVFFSTCKQVKYVFEAFCHMRPGVSLLTLHGGLHQLKRMKTYDSFCQKQHAVLFATDIAARGLDFPDVNWVVQMDCPEDTNSYIHRAGRTARYQGGGESLLVLLPSEESMIDQLRERKIPINMIKINPNKLLYPNRKLEAQLARNVELKQRAQKAFVAYIKSVFLMKDKSIFNVHSLNTDAFARSLGLAIPPNIKFLQNKKKNSNQKQEKDNLLDKFNKNLLKYDDEEQESAENESSEAEVAEKKPERNGKQKIKSQKSNGYKENDNNGVDDDDDNDDDDDDDDDILTIKRKNINVDDLLPDVKDDGEEMLKSKQKKAVTKAALAKKILKKKIIPNKKTNFDEEGKEIIDPNKSKVSEFDDQCENEEISGINLEKSRKDLKEEDKFDKQRYKENLKKEKREKKRKLKEQEKAAREERESDDGESEGGSEEMEDSDGPDLSWLPDPDKIYGKQEEGGSDDSQSRDEKMSSTSDEESEEEKVHRPSKRKLVAQDDIKKKKKKKHLSSNENMETTDELANLALQLIHTDKGFR